MTAVTLLLCTLAFSLGWRAARIWSAWRGESDDAAECLLDAADELRDVAEELRGGRPDAASQRHVDELLHAAGIRPRGEHPERGVGGEQQGEGHDASVARRGDGAEEHERHA